MVSMRALALVGFVLGALHAAHVGAGNPAGTAFTFQGQLKNEGVPVNDTCALTFSLWDDPVDPHPAGRVGPLLAFEGPDAIPVIDGLFAAGLDFGEGAFNGDPRWLEVSARCSGNIDYIILQPRQAVTAAPVASFSQQTPWNGLLGVPPDVIDGDDNSNAATICDGSGVVLDGDGACLPMPDGHSLDAPDGDPVDAVYVDEWGRVGIGTIAPNSTLTVDGTVRVLSHPASYSLFVNGHVRLYDYVSIGADPLSGLISPRLRVDGGIGIGHGQGVFSESASGTSLGAGFGTNDDHLDLLAGGLSRIRVLSDGRVGVGTLTPAEGNLLDVSGRIRSRSGGYVFPDGTILSSATNANLWQKNVNKIYYTGGNVGIGDMYPVYPLTVDGMIFAKSGGIKFPDATELTSATGANIWKKNGDSTYYNDGKVGIGTASPADRLSVSDGFVSLDTGAGGASAIRFRYNSALRWTLLYRSWAEDRFGLYNEALQRWAITFRTDTNRVGLGREDPTHPFQVGTDTSNGNGAHVTAGGVWTNGSDRNSKHNIRTIDSRAILAQVAELPVSRWQYKGEPDGIEHIGPMAQDFHAAFELGDSDTHIGTLDVDGVALAAIQGLHGIVREKEAELAQMRRKLDAQQVLISELMLRVTAVESGTDFRRKH